MSDDNQGKPTHPAAWVPTLYFAEGIPFFAISLIAGIAYKRLGLRNDTIAFYTSGCSSRGRSSRSGAHCSRCSRPRSFSWFSFNLPAG